MQYKKICEVYEKLKATSKGLEKTQILSGFLEEIKKEPETIYLLQGRLFPDYDERETGVSIQLVIKAISQAIGVGEDVVVDKFKEFGDLGLVVEELFKNKKQSALFSSELTVKKVFNNLRKLSDVVGSGAVEKKMGLIVEILHSASGVEAKYLVRIVLGDMKVGVGNGLLRDAIAEVCFSPNDITEKKKYGEMIQTALDKSTDFAEVFSKALIGIKELEKISLSPGKPVKVMLYPKAKDIADAFEIVGKPAAFEFKYDGFRMMINKDEDGNVKIFTRRLDDVTKQFPEAIKYAKENVNAKTFIIDCEAVGFDNKTKAYKPFQDISQRIRRKYDIEKLQDQLPIELNVFDIIYYNGESLIDKPFLERRKMIEKIVKQVPYKIILAKQIITDDENEAEKFYNYALSEKQEGLMAKNLQAIYKPGARIGYAVKLKPDPNELDLVITGAEWGNGKRAGWLTSFDISCRNEVTGELLEIGKASTGLKELEGDELSFVELTNELKKIIISEDGKHVQVKPEIVVMIGYQNIQASPTYTSGYALRFPRIIKLRPDRGLSDIASLDDIRKEAEKGN